MSDGRANRSHARMPARVTHPIVDVVGPLGPLEEIVGVLPDVNTEEGDETVHRRVVLVGLGHDEEVASRRVKGQEAPPAAEDGRCVPGERLLEGVEGAFWREKCVRDDRSQSIGAHAHSPKVSSILVASAPPAVGVFWPEGLIVLKYMR